MGRTLTPLFMRDRGRVRPGASEGRTHPQDPKYSEGCVPVRDAPLRPTRS